MAAKTFNKFNPFVLALASKKHDLTSDQLKVALCAAANAPVAANAKLADLTPIAYTYLSAREITTTSCTQTGGLLSLVIENLTITAADGTAAGFKYVVLYNDDATDKDLIGWWARDADVVLEDGDQFQIDDSANVGVVITLQ